MSRDDGPLVHVETPEEWRAWLVEHHATSSGCWAVWWKRSTGRPAPSYEELVLEALAVGWIDSTSKGFDAERTGMWFTPRRAGSGWSRPNKQRLERLGAEGRMLPAGEAAVARAHDDDSWSLLDDVEDLVVPDDLAAALEQRGARSTWEALTPSARKEGLLWLVQAKRAATRESRVTALADNTASGASRPRG